MQEKFVPKVIIDKESATPLHLQLSNQLIQAIFRERPAAGTAVASQRYWAKELDLNHLTVKRSFERLMDDGILVRKENERTSYISADAIAKVSPTVPAIGIILPCPFSQFVLGLNQGRLKYISGIMDEATEMRYSPMILNPPPQEADQRTTREWMNEILPKLSAVIHLGMRALDREDVPLQTILEECYLPQVFVSGQISLPRIGSVIYDMIPGFRAIETYVKDLGHSRIGILSEDLTITQPFMYHAQTVLQDSIRFFQHSSLELREEWIVKTPLEESKKKQERFYRIGNPYGLDTLFDEGDQLTMKLDRLFAATELPTVFWCATDVLAIRLIIYLKRRGYRVPEDFSVIGTNGCWESEFVEPALTTLRIPMYEIGRQSVNLGMEHFYQGMTEENRQKRLPVSLIVRQSSGLARTVR